jgi:NAD(P)-dependent dehydrogenase (short-subunit alcohol dehydrogenase family)
MSVEGIMDLDGTIALVTGGGSGLGEATARRLSAAGARVAVLDVSLEAARRVADDIGGEALAADVSNTTDVEAAFEQAIQALGGAPRVVFPAPASARHHVFCRVTAR